MLRKGGGVEQQSFLFFEGLKSFVDIVFSALSANSCPVLLQILRRRPTSRNAYSREKASKYLHIKPRALQCRRDRNIHAHMRRFARVVGFSNYSHLL